MHRKSLISERKIGRLSLRALAMTAIAVVVSSTWVAFGATPEPASAAPFDPDVPMVWISQGDGSGGTLLSEAAQANGEVNFSPVGTAATYNAIGYRQSNGYIYGITPPLGPDPANRSHNIVRINSDGQSEAVVGSIPVAPDYTPQNSLIAGTFGEGTLADRFLVTRTDNDLLWSINANNGNYQQLTLTGPPLQAPGGASDITAAYGYLWGVAQNGDYIIRIDPVNLTRREIPVPAALFADNGSFGGAWTYGNGNLAFSNNDSGTITQIRVTNPGATNPTFTRVSVVDGPPSGNNDGTSAPGEPADLGIEKTGTATVTVGGQITWDITVTNNGPGGSSGFILNDAVPGNVTGVSVSSPDNQCGLVGNQLTCTGNQLLSGDSVTYTLTGTAPNAPTTIANTASVVGYEEDLNGANDQDTATTIVTAAPAPGFSVTKTVSSATASPGDVVEYTVLVRNTGNVPFTAANPATFTDNLSGVLDDATYNNDASGGATYAAPTLSWSGAVPVGQAVEVTYSVTVGATGTGDGDLDNAVVPGQSGTCVDCGTETDLQSFSVDKAASTATVSPGGIVNYTVTVTNTGNAAYTAADPATFTDDLSDVLDDATYNNDASLGAVVTGTTLSWSGAIPVDQSVQITYSVTVGAAGTGDGNLDNAVIPGDGGDCIDCETETNLKSFSVLKAASSTDASPGDVVSYTVTVTNTGNTDYTAADPASFTDDLSGVLDDATYNNDANAGATYAAPTLSWAGALAQDQSVSVTYSVTVGAAGTGDGNLDNAVIPGETGDCVNCGTETDLQSFSVSKVASSPSASPGGIVSYTVTVTNTGNAPYTAADPASFTDDLSDVLDDATYNNDANNGATYSAPTLSWSGAIPVDGSVSITYSVTVGAAGTGDGNLDNAVVPGNGGDCAICETETDLQSFSVTKQASSSTASPGDVLTYTVTVTNTGETAYTAANPASFTDDLSAVLDDATYNDDANNGATYTAPNLSWSGAIPVDGSVSVTYSVTVGAAGTGDGNLNNAVVPGGNGGDCGTCGTETDLRSFSITKTATSATAVPGSVIGYTVLVTNTGQSAFTAADPATFTDDLSDVIDDATYNNDANNGATYSAPTLSWSGAIPVDGSVSITYSVTVGAAGSGNGDIDNAVVAGDGGDCAVCGTETDLKSYSVVKTATGAEAALGDTVGYMITVTNTGRTAYTAEDPATFTDDLSGVLDDATYNNDATLGAVLSGTTLSWSGALGVDQALTITYSVTVDNPPTGDRVLQNVVSTPTGDCAPGSTDPDCSTTTDVTAFSVLKTADTTVVDPGGVVNYTITVTNTGNTAVPNASFVDDMSGVLDDATFNDDATNGATLTGTTLNWSGPLALGQTVVIEYSVTLNATQTGDQILRNAVLAQGAGYCVDTEGCSTVTEGRSFSVTKSATPSVLDPGDVVTYTVTVQNTGEADYTAESPAAFTDNLSGVVDDATYNGDASNGATVTGSTLNWSGALPEGGSVSVTYSFTVNAPRSGDLNLTNAVVPLGGGHCAENCTTTNFVRSYTVSKTASSAVANPGSVVTYTISITNTGDADYTAESPATFTDDLSAVIDDATYNGDATNGATYSAPTLSWSGAVPVDGTVTVQYSVTVNAPRTGDSILTNAVVPGEGECGANCETVTDVQSFSVVKEASTAVVTPGDVLSYDITVTNTGNLPYTAETPASFTDDLTAVLDDATYNGDASNGAVVTGAQLSWAGALALGESITITYSVTVNEPATGDRLLTNAVVPGPDGGGCDTAGDCTTETTERTFSVSKIASGSTVPLDGVLTYSILVTNTGTAPYTEADPASFTDDLSDVLDDATYNGDATAGAVVTGETLSWAGALEVDQMITVTYSVTVNNPSTGDHHLSNGVIPGDGTGGECDPEQPCSVDTPIAAFHVTKEADAETVVPGQTITYTITVSNIGEVDYTDATPASFSDDLSDVLDDAVYNDDASGGAVYTDPVLSWSGPLAIGESAEITYSATVNLPSTGDDILDNSVVTPAGTGGECSIENPAADCGEISKVASYSVEKTSDAEQAKPGDVITYTVTVVNTGQVAYTSETPATFADDMTDVLDDAGYNDDATVTRGDVVAPSDELSFEAPVLDWAGSLEIGESATVTYSVTVDAPATGDRIATNVVLSDGEIGGGCANEGSCAPETLISSFEVSKEASGSQATAGDVITYTVTVTNTGQVDYTEDAPASFTDDLSDVLDEATYNGDASSGATVSDGVLSWSGPLEVGASSAVTYSVTVNDGVRSGSLRNAVIAPDDSGSVCSPDSLADGCSTDTTVVPPLATTGADAAVWLSVGLGALLVLLAGAGLLVIGARRPTREV